MGKIQSAFRHHLDRITIAELETQVKPVWGGTELDLEQLDTKRGMRRPHRAGGQLHLRRVQSVAESEDKRLWIGSDDGSVVEYDPAFGTLKLVGQEGSIYQTGHRRCPLSKLVCAMLRQEASASKKGIREFRPQRIGSAQRHFLA
jgi:hypothetical protein